MKRAYDAPPRIEGETNENWCDRYAASIPAEALLTEIVMTMHTLRKRRGPAWAQMSKLCGHGSGVSSAIIKRFMPQPVPAEAIR